MDRYPEIRNAEADTQQAPMEVATLDSWTYEERSEYLKWLRSDEWSGDELCMDIEYL